MMTYKSIRARVTTTFAVSIAILMLFVSGGLIWYARYDAERNARAMLSDAAREIMAERSDFHGHINSKEFFSEIRDDLQAENLSVIVRDSSGQTIIRSAGKIPLRPSSDGKWRTLSLQIDGNDVTIGLPWDRTERSIGSLTMMLLFLTVVVVILAMVGSWVSVGRTLTPISLLSREAQAASADSLHINLSAPSQDSEIVELVAVLNGLLDRVSQTAAAKSRFYSAASHELRTPLQALLGHLEVALSKPRTGEEYNAVLIESCEQTQRLVSLVRELLLLNQLDSPSPLSVAVPVDLADICARTLTHFQHLIDKRGLVVEIDLPKEALIDARPNHAEILIRNLMENAVKYCIPGGKLTAKLSTRGEAVLEVINDYPSDERLDVDSLFEPFYRLDTSRSSASGGNGLGLAICKSVASANEWDLHLQHDGSSMKATVQFDKTIGRA